MEIINGKPIQTLSYKEKIKDDNAWGKQNIEYFLQSSYFYAIGYNSTVQRRDLQMLYNVYNNQLPENWFNYISNPLNTSKAEHANFPARIRAYTILRNNIDILIGMFNKRNFNYMVTVQGEDAYNKFFEAKMQMLQQTIQNEFQRLQQDPNAEVQIPDDILSKYNSSYRDNLAIKAQKWLGKFKERENIIEVFRLLFKDWLIAGEIYTRKYIVNGEVTYKRQSPLYIDYDKSVNSIYIEDGEWVTSLEPITLSDVVDQFYDEIKSAIELNKLSNTTSFIMPAGATVYNFFTANREAFRGKINMFHCAWKSKKKIGLVTSVSPDTGEVFQSEVDEDYKKGPNDIDLKWEWVNEVWEGYRVDKDLYFGIKPIACQRNEIMNKSACKLPYNGKRWSDTHALNTSILELAMPYQILYIIVQYRIELALAKSKMFALLDINMIPDKDGWDEEKTVYYADALGFFFMDRNKIGVDKQFNQYTVINLMQYEHIQQLIGLQNYIMQRTDELFGLPPQVKGQISSSDGLGTTDRSIFQSSLITDKTFTDFDDFLKKEYQGFIDLSKYEIAHSGFNEFVQNDDFTTEFVKIDPEEYCNASLNIFATNSAKEADKLNSLKQLAERFAQDPNVKASTVAELIGAENYAEVKQILKTIEKTELDIQQQQSQAEQDHELAIENTKKEFMQYEKMLDGQYMNAEYDRKEQIELIKGDIQIELAASAVSTTPLDTNNNNVLDINEIEDRALDREKIYHTKATEREKLNMEKYKIDSSNTIEKEKLKLKNKEIDTNLKIAKTNKNSFDGKKKK